MEGDENLVSKGLHLFQRVQPFIEQNHELLEPQRHGWLDVRTYFENDLNAKTVPALVIIPTGCGKTGLASILPFQIAQGRVLIITPGRVVNDGVLEKLDSSSPDNFWLKRNVLFHPDNLPVVVRFRSDLNDEPLREADIVIGNVQQMLSRNRNSLINRVEGDFFDMIIVDEGHHAPADSWQAVFEHFPSAKKVLMTGTPFRGDGQPIHAQKVYHYTLGKAMHQRLVKRMIREHYISDQLLFTVDGFDHSLTLSEVLRVKDQEWVSRSVAYSVDCTRQVAEQSLAILKEKRQTGTAHKILATACSIKHAEQIRSVYEELGASATIIHSDMDDEEKASNIRDFERDRCQIMVHVSMLGEGYDHPEISVVAMFKPYRSLNEYVQLAGRALRTIRDSQHDEIDNVAHLVYHKELNLERLWEYYRTEQRRAEIIGMMEETLGIDDDEEGSNFKETEPTVPVDMGEVRSVGQGHIDSKSFLDDFDIIASYESAKVALNERVTRALDALKEEGVSASSELKELLIASIRKQTLKSKRPDLELDEMRQSVHSQILDAVAELLNKYEIDPHGRHEFRRLRASQKNAWIRGEENEVFLVKMINYELKRFIGRSRKDWGTKDYLSARHRLREILELIDCHGRGEVS
jgi:superfamily II DNA or RNA helicase